MVWRSHISLKKQDEINHRKVFILFTFIYTSSSQPGGQGPPQKPSNGDSRLLFLSFFKKNKTKQPKKNNLGKSGYIKQPNFKNMTSRPGKVMQVNKTLKCHGDFYSYVQLNSFNSYIFQLCQTLQHFIRCNFDNIFKSTYP